MTSFAIISSPTTVITVPSEDPPAAPLPDHAAQAISDAQLHIDLTQQVSSSRLAAALRRILRAISGGDGGQQQADIELLTISYIQDGERSDNLPPLPEALPTRIERASALLQSCQAALRGPASAAARTGLIVAMTLAIRESVKYYAEQALNSHDVAEANRAWAAAGVFLVGPCLNILGALREEFQLCANTRSRLGRAAMLGLCMGTGLALALRGGAEHMLPAAIGTAVYGVIRDITNAFFPLESNVADFSLVPSAAAAGLYGAMGGLFDSLAAQVPRYEGDLGFGLFNHLVNALPSMAATLCYSVLDDLILPLLNHGPRDTPEQAPFSIDVAPRRASPAQVVAAVTTNAALRISAINVINGIYAAMLPQLIAYADGSEEAPLYRDVISGALLGAAFMVIYLPFVYGTLASPRPDPTLEENPDLMLTRL